MVEVRTANQLEDLRELLKCGGDVSIAVAYLTRRGLDQIRKPLLNALNNGRRVRLVVDLNSGITETVTLQELVNWSEDQSNQFEFRAFFGGPAKFHGKVYIAHSQQENFITLLTGSYNLTASALHHNWEHGLLVKSCWKGKVGKETLLEFNRVWGRAGAKCLDKQAVKLYSEYHKEIQRNKGNSHGTRNARRALADYLEGKKDGDKKRFWLFKCNVHREYSFGRYGFEKLLKEEGRTTEWGDIIRNYEVRNLMLQMKKGDGVLFYHSGSKKYQEVIGTAQIVREAYPNFHSWEDPSSKYYDAKSSPDNPIWVLVDIQANPYIFQHPVKIESIRKIRKQLSHSEGQEKERLSIYEVTKEEFDEIIKTGNPKPISTN